MIFHLTERGTQEAEASGSRSPSGMSVIYQYIISM